ncbi:MULTISPECIES: phosphatase PAP2 family protein [unclassified Arenibacter]|jgi:undecaprenyl-diphosphatase|uniref:phosphatase PAP2 family protein n=1 Tax=unclassified Arenibacter TaxID=2615047 RepID=UPI000E356F07|nr:MULTISPECIES: phosphatase PAP2 family protein [unclassified Arenibacter]MCM4164176.1 phosphatase PAP2 family protein [Arenibacter sp. A80]RFT55974.1 phosphatase PAP2 family protein [Arenibacter sp. P308M17]
MLDQLLQWDRDTFIYLNSLGIENHDVFWSYVTNFSTWIPLFILFIVLIFKAYPKKEAFWVLGTVLITLIVVGMTTYLVKEWVARLRPNNTEEINTLIRILKSPDGYSFFSGHSSSSFSITTSVFLFLKNKWKWSWLFYIWPLLFALSRIYVGVHYPLDLIVGALAGIFFAIFFHRLYHKMERTN